MTRSSRQVVSIRARLLVLLVSATVLCWLAAIGWSYVDARRELADLFDAQLVQAGRIVLERAGHEVEEALEHDREVAIDVAQDHSRRYEQILHFQVWSARGRLLYRSSPDLPSDPVVPLGSRGFFDRTLHGARWRVLALADRGGEFEIQLCQRSDLRARLAAAVARNMLVPVAAMLPLLAVLIWLATSAGIRPLRRFAAELSGRRPEDVAPLAAGPRPRELAPLALALDGLLDRLRRRLELERRFTADAAHELRTPLAALKTQAQVALGARTPEERVHALEQVVRGTDRMTRLVGQLLTLARIEPDAAEELTTVDLAAVAGEVLAELAPEAGKRGIRVGYDGETAGATVTGSRTLLATLVANLVENALRHGDAGGEVRVVAGTAGDGVVLEVLDDGPGIPEGERTRVFERFHRLPGSRAGSGLGLSIVARIAELHGATISLATGLRNRGLAVRLRFPPG